MPNSTSSATPVPSPQCEKLLSSKRNLRRHAQKILLVPPPHSVCDVYLESFEKMSEARECVELAHDITSLSHCFFYIQLFSKWKAINTIFGRCTHCHFGMSPNQSFPLPQGKARSEKNCVDTISVLVKKRHLLQVSMQNKGGNRRSHSGKGSNRARTL